MKLLTAQRPQPTHHRYLVNGQPRNCAYCLEPLQGEIYRSGNQSSVNKPD